MACSKYTLTNTGSTSVNFNYRRCDDSMWQYQVNLDPNETKNIWLINQTYSIATLFQPNVALVNNTFPLTPTPTATSIPPTPTPTATSISPTPTATSISPTPTATSISPTPTATSISPTPTATSISPTPTATSVSPTATPTETPVATPTPTP